MGHGKDDMVMVAGQQAGFLFGQPALNLQPGTLRTQPVPTGIVPDAFNMPIGTGLHVSTQHGV